MTNRRISMFVMTALVAGLAIFVATATADEHSGTWKMNPAKSKHSPEATLRRCPDDHMVET